MCTIGSSNCPYTLLDSAQGYNTDCTKCQYWKESKKFNNEDIILDKRATKSFLEDLFGPINKIKKEKQHD